MLQSNGGEQGNSLNDSSSAKVYKLFHPGLVYIIKFGDLYKIKVFKVLYK